MPPPRLGFVDSLVPNAFAIPHPGLGRRCEWQACRADGAPGWLLPSPSSGQRVGCLRGCLGLNVAMTPLPFGVDAVSALLAAGFPVPMHGLSLLVMLALLRYREFVADRAAALLTVAPARLASALKLGEAIGHLSGMEILLLRALWAFMPVDPKDERQVAQVGIHPLVAQRVRRLIELDGLLSGW